ncbi:MAG: non-homologous end joining protein Ku [Methanobacterium sp.]
MRSIWSGYLMFGTILIPVRSYAASGNLHLGFHLVHKSDCGRVRYKKVCEKDDEELKPEDIAKAYFVAGECIQFSDEEIESLKPLDTKIMNIQGFCNYEEIPTVALSRPYYLGTGKMQKGSLGGESFHLLKKVLEKSGKVAVITWVSHTNEYLGMLQSYEKGFLLKQILYEEQVRSIDEVEVVDSEIDTELLEMGLQAVQKMSFDFDWRQYTETYSKEVRKLIEKRAIGEEIKPTEVKLAETRSLGLELERMLGHAK